MTRSLVFLAACSTLVAACGGTATLTPGALQARAVTAADATPAVSTAFGQQPTTAAPLSVTASQLRGRRVGDLFVYRFSGTYRDAPVILTEEVLDRIGRHLVIEYTLDEGNAATKLRVRMHSDTGEIANVRRLDGDAEVEATVGDYEQMLAKTVFAPDHNAGRVARKHLTCLVAGHEHDCVKNSFRVYVGDTPATLMVTRSEAMPGRDVEGRLETADGQTLYRAVLLEMRVGTERPTVARSSETPDHAREYVPQQL